MASVGEIRDLSDPQILERIRAMREKEAWGELVIRFRGGRVPSIRVIEDVVDGSEGEPEPRSRRSVSA